MSNLRVFVENVNDNSRENKKFLQFIITNNKPILSELILSEFLNNQLHGISKYWRSDGIKMKEGQFENGVFSGYGILEMDEGVTFAGNWDGDNFQGTLNTEEFRIEGEWKHRQPWNVHGYDVDDELFKILSEGGKREHN